MEEKRKVLNDLNDRLKYNHRGGGKSASQVIFDIFVCLEIAFVERCIRFEENMNNSKGLKRLYWKFRFNIINKKYVKRYE